VSLHEGGETHAVRTPANWSALDRLAGFDTAYVRVSLLYIAGLQSLNFEGKDPIAANMDAAFPKYGR
jgi:hypothetical protein